MPGDRAALEHFPLWPPRPKPVRDVAEFAAILGTPLFAAGAMVLVAWFLGRGLGVRAVLFVFAALLGVLANDVLKTLIGPTPLFEQAHGPSAADNFPSGHVVYAVTLAGSLAVLASERGRRDLVVLAALAIAVMGPMRVADGAHLPSDVVAGYVFGAGWLWSVVRFRAVGGRAAPGTAVGARPVGTSGGW